MHSFRSEKDSNVLADLPLNERPYEKCRLFGPGALSDAELLSVILRNGSRGESALDLSRRLLLDMLGGHLSGIYHISEAQLRSVRGIGPVKTAQLRCLAEISRRISREQVSDGISFHDPDQVAAYFMEELRHAEQEQVILLMLDTKGRLLAKQRISIGTVNLSLISPREIFVTALANKAVSIILLHNHPSGDPTPSRADIELTDRVRRCGDLIGIGLLDHIVIGDRTSVSFRKENLLD